MAKPPPTAAELSAMNQRTNAVGLFNFADAYLLCGKTLTSQKIQGLRFADPIEYLFHHAIELYLKSFLRGSGIDVYDLEKNYGHNLVKLRNKAVALGLLIEQKDADRIQHLKNQGRAIEARYIKTGLKQPLALEAMLGTCERLRDAVQQNLIQAGTELRPGPFYPGMAFDTSHRTFRDVGED